MLKNAVKAYNEVSKEWALLLDRFKAFESCIPVYKLLTPGVATEFLDKWLFNFLREEYFNRTAREFYIT